MVTHFLTTLSRFQLILVRRMATKPWLMVSVALFQRSQKCTKTAVHSSLTKVTTGMWKRGMASVQQGKGVGTGLGGDNKMGTSINDDGNRGPFEEGGGGYQ